MLMEPTAIIVQAAPCTRLGLIRTNKSHATRVTKTHFMHTHMSAHPPTCIQHEKSNVIAALSQAANMLRPCHVPTPARVVSCCK